MRSTYCTVEAVTTARHEASRGLSATAELLGFLLAAKRPIPCPKAALGAVGDMSVSRGTGT